MKYAFYLFASLISVHSASAQGKFEPKIIIMNSFFYAVEIENQVAKLYIGKIDQPVDSANVYALPAGTKRRTTNFLPFSWNMNRDTIYAINFTESSQNNRLTSLKSIPLNSLRLYDSSKVQQQLMEAARLNSVIQNMPLKTIISKYKYMDDLFFDLVMKDGVLYQLISVNDELTVWSYSNGAWQQSEVYPFDAHNYFLSYIQSNQIFIINAKGEIFRYDGQLIPLSSVGFPLSEYIMINNYDSGKTSYVNRNALENSSLSLQSILDKFSKN